MKVNVPRRVRIALYLLNVLGTPVVVYARAKGWIGDLELALWGAEVTAAMALAGLNVGAGPQGVSIRVDADQLTALERGQQIQRDLDAYRRNGGEGGVL
ncbi:hypothetical protein ACFFOS_27935 [Nocardioides kongjuensis]|uniref:Uncharacterized protein n=1 Tax=Nocardioides kongjuensis TaxID=349522 RepID=A0A852RJZ0_9ACTN|nr:hypothetical protein [Nocardioides kongjuensis]NYD33837.1 hypothetical protein [Nocardioides kongjuensis]